MNVQLWTFLHPQMTIRHLGFLPSFFNEADPRPAAQQINDAYVAGWTPFEGFTLASEGFNLLYPGDPPTRALAYCQFRDETVVFYEHEWVGVVQRDRTFEVCRLD